MAASDLTQLYAHTHTSSLELGSQVHKHNIVTVQQCKTVIQQYRCTTMQQGDGMLRAMATFAVPISHETPAIEHPLVFLPADTLTIPWARAGCA